MPSIKIRRYYFDRTGYIFDTRDAEFETIEHALTYRAMLIETIERQGDGSNVGLVVNDVVVPVSADGTPYPKKLAKALALA